MTKKILFLLSMILIVLLVLCYFLFVHKHSKSAKVMDDRPNDSEPYTESKIIKSEITDEQNEIELKYDEYVVASGFIGASDNAYFTRNKILYHLVISTDTVTKIAEGVKKIEADKDTLLVYKGENFKIIKEDDYITYIN